MKKEKIIKHWKFFTVISIVILAILMMSFYALKVSDKLYKKSEKIQSDSYIENIEQGMIIEQKIIAEENNFNRVDIEFEPFKEKWNIGGEVAISIKDENNIIIDTKHITRNNIREISTYEFQFKKQKESKNKTYTLKIAFKEIEENKEFFSIKIDENAENNNDLTIDGVVTKGKVCTQQFYLSATRQIIFIIAAIILAIYVFGISTYFYLKREIKPEKIFLWTVPVICIFYMLSMPTIKNHDELYHWYRAYEVSIGKPMTGIDGDTLGTVMPESIVSIATDNWQTITYEDVQETLNIELEPDKTRNIYSETSAVYSFIQYLPQGIGIFIMRIFTNKVALLAYAGRFVNMLVSIAFIYLAIKKIPFGKKILLLMSYIPIAIEGFTSLSPDAMTISVAFLYIAYILSLAFDKKDNFIGKKEITILTVLSVVMALCKIVYIPMVLLMFMIPKQKFKNEKKVQTIIIIALVACILNLAWLAVSGIYLAHFKEGDASYQVKSVLLHPITYIQNCLYTLNVNGSSYITTMLGEKLGWGELVNIHSIVPYTLLILAIWITIADETIKDKFMTYQKIIIFLTIAAITILIFTSLYVQWTTIGADFIAGIQGRYFIPILPLIMILVGSNIKIYTEYKEATIAKSIGIIGIILQIIVVLQIIICHL